MTNFSCSDQGGRENSFATLIFWPRLQTHLLRRHLLLSVSTRLVTPVLVTFNKYEATFSMFVAPVSCAISSLGWFLVNCGL